MFKMVILCENLKKYKLQIGCLTISSFLTLNEYLFRTGESFSAFHGRFKTFTMTVRSSVVSKVKRRRLALQLFLVIYPVSLQK